MILKWILFVVLVYIFSKLFTEKNENKMKELQEKLNTKDREHNKLLHLANQEISILKNTIKEMRKYK